MEVKVVKICHRVSKRGEYFIVFWSDNTTTKVKLSQGDKSDPYLAFLYCLGKKIFLNKGLANKFIRDKEEVFESEVKVKGATKRLKRQVANIMNHSALNFVGVLPQFIHIIPKE